MFAWLCKIIGHREGLEPLFPENPRPFLYCTDHRCWRCGAPLPEELKPEYVTNRRVRWRRT